MYVSTAPFVRKSCVLGERDADEVCKEFRCLCVGFKQEKADAGNELDRMHIAVVAISPSSLQIIRGSLMCWLFLYTTSKFVSATTWFKDDGHLPYDRLHFPQILCLDDRYRTRYRDVCSFQRHRSQVWETTHDPCHISRLHTTR